MFAYHRSDVTKSKIATVPSNVLSNKTLIECAVSSCIAPLKRHFTLEKDQWTALWKRKNECFFQTHLKVNGLFSLQQGNVWMNACTYTYDFGDCYFDINVKLPLTANQKNSFKPYIHLAVSI